MILADQLKVAHRLGSSSVPAGAIKDVIKTTWIGSSVGSTITITNVKFNDTYIDQVVVWSALLQKAILKKSNINLQTIISNNPTIQITISGYISGLVSGIESPGTLNISIATISNATISNATYFISINNNAQQYSGSINSITGVNISGGTYTNSHFIMGSLNSYETITW